MFYGFCEKISKFHQQIFPLTQKKIQNPPSSLGEGGARPLALKIYKITSKFSANSDFPSLPNFSLNFCSSPHDNIYNSHIVACWFVSLFSPMSVYTKHEEYSNNNKNISNVFLNVIRKRESADDEELLYRKNKWE